MICKLRKYTIKYPSSLPWYNSSIFIIELNATINYLTYEFKFKDYVQFSCHYTTESKKLLQSSIITFRYKIWLAFLTSPKNFQHISIHFQ